jgi:hypothetical protein
MAHKTQPERWEALILTAALAVAGTLFLFDKLGTLMRTSDLFSRAILHSAPMLLVVVGVSLMLADAVTPGASNHPKEGRYE